MNESIKKNHHYVPQFYLRNFSDNGKNIGMYRFKGEQYIQNASIKSVAYRKYLYGDDGQLEDILSFYESKWKVIIKKIIDNQSINKILDKSEFSSLLQFISVSHVRTSKLADNYIEFYNTMLNINQQMRKSHGLDGQNDYERHFKKMKEIPNSLAVTGLLLEGKEYLKNLMPLLLVNKTNYDFITCDNPIVQYNQLYQYRNYNRNYGWGTAGIQVFLILNPKIALCFYDAFVYDVKETGDFYINVNAKNQVMGINKLVVHNSYEALFFNKFKKEDIENLTYDKQIVPGNSTHVFQKSDDKDNNIVVSFGNHSIMRKVKLNFFDIIDKYKIIDLPLHLGGLIREDMLIDKFMKNNPKYGEPKSDIQYKKPNLIVKSMQRFERKE